MLAAHLCLCTVAQCVPSLLCLFAEPLRVLAPILHVDCINLLADFRRLRFLFFRCRRERRGLGRLCRNGFLLRLRRDGLLALVLSAASTNGQRSTQNQNRQLCLSHNALLLFSCPD